MDERDSVIQELLDRVRALERWAIANEQEEWEHRVYLAQRGKNEEKFRDACRARSAAVLQLPGGFEVD